MSLQAIPLPWPADSLVGFLTAEQNRLHYEYHYLHYVKSLNDPKHAMAIAGRTLDQIMLEMIPPLSDDAAQKWNHDFFWAGLSPQAAPIHGEVSALIANQYGSFEVFQNVFEKYVHDHFASGWIWLAWDPQGKVLMTIDGQDAYNPLKDGYYPLLTLDLWEHGFEPLYPGDKDTYCRNMWKYVDWNRVNRLIKESITGPPVMNLGAR